MLQNLSLVKTWSSKDVVYIYIYCKATSHLTIIRCLGFVLCKYQMYTVKWLEVRILRLRLCVSTRHHSTPNPDVSKNDPFLFTRLIGGFDEKSFSPTSLASLQQSLITHFLDDVFRPFRTPKTWAPLEGNGEITVYPWLTEGHFGQLWKWVHVPGDLHHSWRLLSVKGFAAKRLVVFDHFPWNWHVHPGFV